MIFLEHNRDQHTGFSVCTDVICIKANSVIKSNSAFKLSVALVSSCSSDPEYKFEKGLSKVHRLTNEYMGVLKILTSLSAVVQFTRPFKHLDSTITLIIFLILFSANLHSVD